MPDTLLVAVEVAMAWSMETRGPQSMQSVPKANVANLELGPPLPPALRQLFVCTMPF